jgi:hypothetical protein
VVKSIKLKGFVNITGANNITKDIQEILGKAKKKKFAWHLIV